MSERLEKLERIIPMVEHRAAHLDELLLNHVGDDIELARQHITCSDCRRIESLKRENEELLDKLEKMQFAELVKPLRGQRVLFVESEAYQSTAIGLSIQNHIWPNATDTLPENLPQYLKDNKICGVIAHLDRQYYIEQDLNSLEQVSKSGIPVVLLVSTTLEFGLRRAEKSLSYLNELSISKFKKTRVKPIEQAMVILAKSFTDLGSKAST